MIIQLKIRLIHKFLYMIYNIIKLFFLMEELKNLTLVMRIKNRLK